jgi:hypothetical protein
VLTKYKVSEKEIIRREKAFLSLCVSLFLGSILASILLNFPVPYLFFIGLALFLFTMNFWLKKFFDKYLKMKTCLSKEFLTRGKRKFLIREINKLTIKKTTNNTIREVGVFFGDGKSLFINGLSNFEKFGDNLLKTVGKNVVIKNSREPMDFDSIFFYPILGLILSSGTVYLLKLMTTASYQTMNIVLYASTIYIFAVVMYFVISKPISRSY